MKKHKTRTTHNKIVRVLAQGTFDLLHPGHVHYLTFARAQGDRLTVIVARNASVEKIKHRSPVLDEHTRLKMVAALRVVDKAVLGGKGNMLDKVVELNPNVIVLGYDQGFSIAELRNKLNARKWTGKIVRAPAYKDSKYKSSIIKRKIALNHQKTST